MGVCVEADVPVKRMVTGTYGTGYWTLCRGVMAPVEKWGQAQRFPKKSKFNNGSLDSSNITFVCYVTLRSHFINPKVRGQNLKVNL